jgi:hypothetical protein
VLTALSCVAFIVVTIARHCAVRRMHGRWRVCGEPSGISERFTRRLHDATLALEAHSSERPLTVALLLLLLLLLAPASRSLSLRRSLRMCGTTVRLSQTRQSREGRHWSWRRAPRLLSCFLLSTARLTHW